MTERIRWIDSPDTSTTAFIGWAGSIHESQFAIYKPDQDGGDYILASQLSGLDEKRSFDVDPEKLKAEAERWLEEFVSSLGAIFPDPAQPECYRCEKPILGTPVTSDDDPLHRTWCSEECADASAEAAYEQHYRPGVAT